MKRRALFIYIFAFVLLWISSSALAASREGFARGRIDPIYSGVNDAVPLLSSFYFLFQKRIYVVDRWRPWEGEWVWSSRAVDNQINTIMVYPAGIAEDVSPNAQFRPPQVDSGKIALIFKDSEANSGSDWYFYKVSHNTKPLNYNIRRFSIRGLGCPNGRCEHILPSPSGSSSILPFRGVFVLIGFQINFTGGRDRNVDEIAVFEEGGKLTVILKDSEYDSTDTISYAVDYTWINPLLIRDSGEESGTATGGARVNLPSGKKVIQGFYFDFSKADRPLREIGVITSNKNLEVYYADKYGDDEFKWWVRWAVVGEQVIFPSNFMY